MMQRYIVFLNERAVIVHQDINMLPENSTEMYIRYTDKTALAEAYKRFYSDEHCFQLYVEATDFFTEACKAFNSLFTRIEAAGGIVRNPNNDYLFIKRLGKWDLPKGKLHKKEAAQTGAIREVTEETGLTDLSITKKLPSTFHIYTDRKGKEVLKETFWFEMTCEQNQTLIPQTEEDITEVRWFSADELHIPLHDTYASLKNLLEHYLKPTI
jgi:8-oxo-dGTP pyrophosphatase MutT (NUDIX family)